MIDNRLRRRHPLVQTIFDNWLYFLVLLFLWRFPHLVAEWTNSEADPARRAVGESSFWQSVMIDTFILAILAMSYNLMLGFTGLISFGHAAFFGAGVYVMAILVGQFKVSFVSALMVALLTGTLISLIWSIAAFRIKGVYFAMFTLAFAEIFFLMARLTMFKHLTGGEDGIRWTVPDWINPVKNRLQFYNFALACVVITFILVRRLMNSPSGKVLVAIRDNETRARTLGFNVFLYKTLAIMVSGALATLAGILHAIDRAGAETSVLGTERTINPLIMSLIGGLGTIPGPALGAGLIRISEQYLRKPELQVDLNFMIYRYRTLLNTESYWGLALGAAFIIFVLAIPYGVVGATNNTWLRVRRWLRIYIYNPVVRQNPQLATWATPFTGEPSEVALALAQQPAPMTLIEWARRYPVALMNAITFIVAVGTGLLTWDWQVGVSWALFLILISIPVRVVLWLIRWPKAIYLIGIGLGFLVPRLLFEDDALFSVMVGFMITVVNVGVGIYIYRWITALRRYPLVNTWIAKR
ncbi:MAG: branched-chain amino acid ABC transporter permease [Anaerolineales bacterium]|nr:branched-chain amino acid ABC transporter permease [Anaerolineales bacterium]